MYTVCRNIKKTRAVLKVFFNAHCVTMTVCIIFNRFKVRGVDICLKNKQNGNITYSKNFFFM